MFTISARNLLQQWTSSAVQDDPLVLGLDNDEGESPLVSRTASAVKREWDNMVEQNEEEYGLDLDLKRIEQRKKGGAFFTKYKIPSSLL